MQRQRVVQVVAAVVVVVFALGIWMSGDRAKASWLRYYSAAVLVATLALGAWEQWVWRARFVQRFASVPRSLNGTWRGTLESYWQDPATNQRPAPIVVYLVVRQTASRSSVRLLTSESASASTIARLSDVQGEAVLAYMYVNTPELRVEHRSRAHNGSAFLRVTGRPATRLRGRYWTDRDSRGEMVFEDRVLHHAEDFRDAASLFSAFPPLTTTTPGTG
jgi:hypothetical protein